MASTDQLHANNLFSMKDAVCLVTGGGTGIGLMASQALAANGRQSLLPRHHCRPSSTQDSMLLTPPSPLPSY
jgi:hypothetical protein